jgi:hypothetical protein
MDVDEETRDVSPAFTTQLDQRGYVQTTGELGAAQIADPNDAAATASTPALANWGLNSSHGPEIIVEQPPQDDQSQQPPPQDDQSQPPPQAQETPSAAADLQCVEDPTTAVLQEPKAEKEEVVDVPMVTVALDRDQDQASTPMLEMSSEEADATSAAVETAAAAVETASAAVAASAAAAAEAVEISSATAPAAEGSGGSEALQPAAPAALSTDSQALTEAAMMDESTASQSGALDQSVADQSLMDQSVDGDSNNNTNSNANNSNNTNNNSDDDDENVDYGPDPEINVEYNESHAVKPDEPMQYNVGDQVLVICEADPPEEEEKPPVLDSDATAASAAAVAESAPALAPAEGALAPAEAASAEGQSAPAGLDDNQAAPMLVDSAASTEVLATKASDPETAVPTQLARPAESTAPAPDLPAIAGTDDTQASQTAAAVSAVVTASEGSQDVPPAPPVMQELLGTVYNVTRKMLCLVTCEAVPAVSCRF